jgi:hypothetical protein
MICMYTLNVWIVSLNTPPQSEPNPTRCLKYSSFDIGNAFVNILACISLVLRYCRLMLPRATASHM